MTKNMLEPNIFDLAVLQRGIAALDKKLSRVLQKVQEIVEYIRENEDEIEELS